MADDKQTIKFELIERLNGALKVPDIDPITVPRADLIRILRFLLELEIPDESDDKLSEIFGALVDSEIEEARPGAAAVFVEMLVRNGVPAARPLPHLLMAKVLTSVITRMRDGWHQIQQPLLHRETSTGETIV